MTKTKLDVGVSSLSAVGTIVYDSNFIYVCVGVNTWKYVVITAW